MQMKVWMEGDDLTSLGKPVLVAQSIKHFFRVNLFVRKRN